MKTIASLLVIAAFASASAQTAMPTPRGKDSAAVAALFTRHLTATGGAPNGAASAGTKQYMHVSQQMDMGGGAPPVDMDFYLLRPAPGKTAVRARSSVNMPMMGMLDTYVNGDNGWVTTPSGPMLLTPEQVKMVAANGNPDPLMNMPQGTLTVAPRETIDGRLMDGVRFVDTTGADAVLYFDVKTGLASAIKGGTKTGIGQDTTMFVLLSEYKAFGGVSVPTVMSVRQGPMQTMTMRILNVDFAPFDTMMFVPPAAVLEMLKQRKP